MQATWDRQPFDMPGFIAKIVLIAALAGIVVLAVNWSRHATDGHHAEQASINACITGGGTLRQNVYKERFTGNLFLPCNLPDGRIGVAMYDPKTNRIFNAYVPRDGTWAKVIKWLDSKGTPFKGPLPGDIP